MRTFLSVAVLLVTYEPAPSMVRREIFRRVHLQGPAVGGHRLGQQLRLFAVFGVASGILAGILAFGNRWLKGKKNLRRQARLPEGRQAY